MDESIPLPLWLSIDFYVIEGYLLPIIKPIIEEETPLYILVKLKKTPCVSLDISLLRSHPFLFLPLYG